MSKQRELVKEWVAGVKQLFDEIAIPLESDHQMEWMAETRYGILIISFSGDKFFKMGEPFYRVVHSVFDEPKKITSKGLGANLRSGKWNHHYWEIGRGGRIIGMSNQECIDDLRKSYSMIEARKPTPEQVEAYREKYRIKTEEHDAAWAGLQS